VRISDSDGDLLVDELQKQTSGGRHWELSDSDKKRIEATKTDIVRTPTGQVSVVIPESEPSTEGHFSDAVIDTSVRESIRVQAMIVEIGAKMGFKSWVPKSDRQRVDEELSDEGKESLLIGQLPLNYNDATLKTIENIDVLWMKNRSIVRAFEVEHTTAIYSGLLRMADLLALQPNIDIRLHIVAPDDRREKVLGEIQRPVFSLLEKGPLARSCSFLSYTAIESLHLEPKLAYLKDSYLEELEEFVV
jgi:hypothetical protein